MAVYGLAYRVLEGLMVLPAYFMLALFPEIARLTEDRARVDGIVTAALARDGGVRAAACVVLGIVFADDIVAVIGGDAFADAAWVLRILMLALGISYVNGVYGNALLAIGRQDALFKWSLVILGFNLAANLALIPPFGVVGASIAVVLSEALAFLAVRRLYGSGRPRAADPARPSYPAGRRVVMVAASRRSSCCPRGPSGRCVTVVVGSALGLAVYVRRDRRAPSGAGGDRRATSAHGSLGWEGAHEPVRRTRRPQRGADARALPAAARLLR